MNKSNLSDNEILALYKEFCNRGKTANEKKAKQFFDLFNCWLVSFVRRSSSSQNKSEIEDRVQEVWIKLLNFCGKEKEATKLWGLLKMMSKNVVMDYYRSRKKRTGYTNTKSNDNAIREIDFYTLLDNTNDQIFSMKNQTATLEDEITGIELIDIFNNTFRKLSSIQRNTMHLHLCQNYSTKEIANITESEYEAVRTRIRNGTYTLKKAVKKYQEGKENDE